MDIWSLGILLLALITGDLPSSFMDATERLSASILQGKFNGLVVDLLEKLLCEDPRSRISAKEVLCEFLL